MDNTLYNYLEQFTQWLLPPSCAGCQQALSNNKAHYCTACDEQLPYLNSACIQCGQPFSGLNDHCGKCLSRPPAFDTCFCPFEYASPISDDICRLKYGDEPQMAKRLARLFMRELQHHDIRMPDALISVPMHISTLRLRGFNQSTQLAKELSNVLKIPLITGGVAKTKATPRQATQSLIQRKNNVTGSFEIKHQINFKHLAIIDDVVTTGATTEEIAKILKKNGVDYVQVWGIARTR